MVWLIIALVLLFLLFYPYVILADMEYRNEDWQGKVVICPIFTIPWIKFTLWDSNKPKKEKPPKSEKKKKEKKKKNKKNEEEVPTTVKKKGFLASLKNQPLSETISMALDILKSAGRGIKRLRIRIAFGYAFEDPATMGYLTAGIYSVVPCFLGDMRKSRWRIGIYPQWQETETMGFLKGRATLCLFDIFYAFGSVLARVIKIVVKKLRRK